MLQSSFTRCGSTIAGNRLQRALGCSFQGDQIQSTCFLCENISTIWPFITQQKQYTNQTLEHQKQNVSQSGCDSKRLGNAEVRAVAARSTTYYQELEQSESHNPQTLYKSNRLPNYSSVVQGQFSGGESIQESGQQGKLILGDSQSEVQYLKLQRGIQQTTSAIATNAGQMSIKGCIMALVILFRKCKKAVELAVFREAVQQRGGDVRVGHDGQLQVFILNDQFQVQDSQNLKVQPYQENNSQQSIQYNLIQLSDEQAEAYRKQVVYKYRQDNLQVLQLQKLQPNDVRDVQHICRMIESRMMDNIANCTIFDCSVLLTNVAKLNHTPSQPFMVEAAKKVCQSPHQCDIKDLSRLLWVFKRYGFFHGPFVRASIDITLRTPTTEVDTQFLASLFQVLVDTQYTHTPTIKQLTQLLSTKIHEIDQDSLPAFLWCFLHLQKPQISIIDAMAARVPECLPYMKTMSVCDTINALSKCGYYNSDVYDAVAAELLLRVSRLNPVQTTRALEAFSHQKHSHPKLYQELGERMVDLMPQASAYEVSASVAAVARVGVELEELIDAARVQFMGERLSAFKPKDIVELAFGLAQAKHHNNEAAWRLARYVLTYHEQFRLRQLCNVMWHLQLMTTTIDKKMLEPAIRMICDRHEELPWYYLARTMTTMTQVYVYDDQLTLIVARRVQEAMEEVEVNHAHMIKRGLKRWCSHQVERNQRVPKEISKLINQMQEIVDNSCM